MKLSSGARTLGDLTGRTVLVTGASSGIGAAVVTRFLQAGAARVHAVARREAEMKAIDPRAVDDGRLHIHPLDVTDASGVRRLLGQLEREDPIDTLVIAAGANINPRTFGSVSFEAFDDLVKLNLSGAFYFLRGALEQLRANTGDAVIVSSVAALWPDHSGAAYQATKAGLIGLARGAGWDEHGAGVRITSVLPGVVDTPIVDRRPSPPPPEVREWFMQPEDIAEVILAAVTIAGRTTVSEITLTATRLQSMGNTQQATPALPAALLHE